MRSLLLRPCRLAPVLAACLAAAPPAHAQPADATELSGRWTGTYDCAQGATALELSLRGNENGIVHGTFAFSPTSANPGVPAGRYAVMGRLTGTSLVLRPIDVREMPEDYGPVGVQATVRGRRMAGWIEGPGCGAVTVMRVETASPDAPLPGGYGQQRWATVLDAGAGRLSMDARRRRDEGASVARGWMRWESAVDAPESGLRAGEVTEQEIEIDCDAGRLRVWNTLVYGRDGQLASFDGSAPYAWMEIAEESMYARLADRACAGGPPPRADQASR